MPLTGLFQAREDRSERHWKQAMSGNSTILRSILLASGLAMAPVVTAEDLYVPSVFPTLQDAIDEAEDGDHIHVAAGTYIGALDFQGKAIVVEGTDGATETTLDVFGQGELVSFSSGEGPGTVLRGFRIIGGTGNFVGDPGVLRGGAIYCEESSPALENLIFEGNTATQGGAVYLQDSTASIVGCSFLANEASDGGAIHIRGGNPSISGSDFSSNEAYSRGGAIHSKQGSCSVTGTTFQKNVANNGGAFWLIESTLILTGSDVQENDAFVSGGGLLVEDFSVASIVASTISGNAASIAGGGIEIGPGSDVDITGSTIEGNSAGDGGGIRSYQASLSIASSMILQNTSSGAGGGVLLELTSDGYFSNVIFRGNLATGNGGGINARTSSNLRAVHVTLIDNGAGGLGGGIRAGFESTLELVNSISWDNTAAGDPGVSDMTTPASYLRCLVQGIEDEPQVLFLDPRLDGEGRPLLCSPVIDEGTALIPDLPLSDLAGSPRVIGERPDMGAYEAPEGLGPCFLRGDCGHDGLVDLSDALLSLGWLFNDGEVPGCLDGCDNNDDGVIDLSDPILLLGYLFMSGSPPQPPFPRPGLDPSPDEYRCWTFP